MRFLEREAMRKKPLLWVNLSRSVRLQAYGDWGKKMRFSPVNREPSDADYCARTLPFSSMNCHS